jgi:hypothetical protein
MNRTRIARLALYVAAALLLWSVAVAVSDGFRFRIVGIVISTRDALRPLVLAALLVLASAVADRHLIGAIARSALRRANDGMTAFAAAFARPAWSVAWALAAGMLMLSVALGSRAASGADSSGYVSQAALWARGTLIQTEPLASAVPWPYAVATFAPLGYRPAPGGPRIVPTYAPGLPMLMAVFGAIGGPRAMYLVVPLCAAALILLTYALGLRLGSPMSAMAAAVLTATSPAMLFMVLWPMSDVPVAAFWLGALLLALGPRERSDATGQALSERSESKGSIATGVLTGIAILIRPNLAPLAIVPVALVAINAASRGRAAIVRAAIACALAIAPFAGAVAAINAYLYGGPLQSGYGATGDASSLYSLANIVPNVRRYSGWLFETQGPLIAVALVALAVRLFWRTDRARRLVAIFVALVIASYLPYIVFDVWWYLRFLIPALPILYFFGGDLLVSLTARFGVRTQALVTMLFVAAVGAHGLVFAIDGDVLGVGEGEQRYVEIGRFARDELPNKAVMIAMQHSGSLRYYAGRSTLRYDLLTVPRLDQAVDLLRGLGAGPFLVLEDWEEPVFRERFKDHQTVKTLDSRLYAILDSNTSVRIYDLSTLPAPAAPHIVRHIPRTVLYGRYDE